MQFDALAACIASPACAVTQISTALIVGTLLFLVTSGLSLIFGVLGIINFAHGSFYMLGAYFALTAYKLTGSFAAAMVAGALGESYPYDFLDVSKLGYPTVTIVGVVFTAIFYALGLATITASRRKRLAGLQVHIPIRNDEPARQAS